ncbi:MAG: phosphodiesterase [Balneolaceae bacterium]|nr:MAG: phosphodiesterase [Balneolaceae bacterium]
MKNIFYTLLTLLIVIFTISGCTGGDRSPNAGHVIIIGIDGLSPDGILNSDTPVMDHMMANGSYSMHARAVMPSSSGANWGSMIMGAGPEQHGIISNDWRVDNFVLHPNVVRDDNLFPTIFAVIRDQLPAAEIGAILDWNPIQNFIENDVLSYLALPSDEDETTIEAVTYIKQKKPLFTFIHIDHVDGAGHRFGHGSPQYYASVAKADSLVGEILQSARDAGIYEDTVFLLSSDHGGVGFGHGGNDPREMEIPFIVYGKNVKPNHLLRLPINTFDTPATAVFALGLEIPFEWIGRPVKNAFRGNDDPKLMYHLNNLYPAPDIFPAGEGGYNPPGGLFVGETVTMRIENPAGLGEIRYTVDGSMPGEASPVYDGPLEISENTVVTTRLFDNGRAVSAVNTGYFRMLQNPEGHGLRYTIYEKDDMNLLPDFSTLEPKGTGTTLEITSNNLNLTRRNFVAAVMEGFIEIENEGRYRFYLASDDGSKLYINDREVVDNDGDHGVITRSGTVNLEPGRHEIRVEWFNGGGGYWLAAFIEGPGMERQIVPASMLYLDE